MRRTTVLAGLALALAACLPPARAQQMDMPGMDHHAMPDTTTRASGEPASGEQAEPMPAAGHHAMHGMEAMPHEPARHRPAPASAVHTMGPMQGGSPPPGAREPDYSEGVRIGPMHGIGMAMEDQARFVSLQVDRLEAFHGRHDNGQQWEIQGGVGGSLDKLWLRTEGERSRGRVGGADVELLWRHAVAAFWDTQLGVRTDTGEGPDRQWAAFGIQGLAPYWFELEATGYVGPAGRTAARLRADYELLFTQRLILQPEFELDAYGKADPARGLGSGLSDASLALRLRYEIRREVAPYVGGVWIRRFGATADQGRGLFEWQWVAGVHIRL